MKTRWLWLMLLCAFARQAAGAPLRLAIVAEGPEAAAPTEMLTAELSHRDDLALIERAQIDKIYREQSLSAGNAGLIRLGQILGADGLLVLAPAKTPTNDPPTSFAPPRFDFGARQEQPVFLDARLIAVKPGVILGDTRTIWLGSQPEAWTKGVVRRFEPSFPKLGTLLKDAVPLSILNLRSAAQSRSGEEEERQVKLLLIQQLSREPRFFVLERQQMRRLGEEKDLEPRQAVEFWNGSFVLDGTLDQSGYSQDTITINARLSPPNGGKPTLIETRGSRTNLLQVTDQLVAAIKDAVGLRTAALEWNPAAEAREYLAEARWALKWDLLPEAQQASDAAWALGEHSFECAKVRVLSWMVPDYRITKRGSMTALYSNPDVASLFQHPPGEQAAENARRALDIYRSYTDHVAPDQLKLNSQWYGLGVSNIAAAARVLQNFYLVPPARKTAEGQLGDLRAAAREVADTISKWPTVHTFYETNTPALRFEYPENRPDFSLFAVLIQQGCFIHDRPEDTLAMYRKLMRAPLFPSMHAGLWFRDFNSPRLLGWTDADERRAEPLWREFVKELSASDDLFLRLEARAFAAADAWSAIGNSDFDTRILVQRGRAALEQSRRDQDVAVETNTIALFEFFIANCDAIVASREPALYYNWEWNQLFSRGRSSAATGRVGDAYRTNYSPRISALLAAYEARLKARAQEENRRVVFEEQKRYLSQYTPYDFHKFVEIFRPQDYTRAQAMELLPLVASYRSNLVSIAPPPRRFKAEADSTWVDVFVGRKLRAVIDGAPQGPPAGAVTPVSTPAPAPQGSPPGGLRAGTAPARDLKIISHPLLLGEDSVFPRSLFNDTNIIASVITGVQWCDGKLLVGMSFQGTFNGGSYVGQGAVAIFDAQGGKWDLIRFPVMEADNFAGNGFSPAAFFGPRARLGETRVHLFHNALYFSAGTQIKRFDFKTRQWTVTQLPQHADTHFFTVGGRLFAASSEMIFEVKDDGRESVIMASTRRRPVVSVLDSLDDLGKPVVIVEGPGGGVRAWVKEKVYAWQNGNWREEFALPGYPEIAGQTLLCRADYSMRPLARLLEPGNSSPEVLWEEMRDSHGIVVPPSQRQSNPPPVISAAWPSWNSSRFGHGQATVFNSNVYILGDDLRTPNQPNVWLVSLLRGQPAPVAVPLVFGKAGAGAVEPQRPPSGSRTRSLWLAPDGGTLFIVDGQGVKLWRVSFEDIDRAARGNPNGASPNPGGGFPR